MEFLLQIFTPQSQIYINLKFPNVEAALGSSKYVRNMLYVCWAHCNTHIKGTVGK